MSVEKAVRFRQVSGDLLPAKAETAQAIEDGMSCSSIGAAEEEADNLVKAVAPAPQETEASSSGHQLPRTKSVEALALDNRLDKITAFVKNVESQ